jgi:hypothetical protein
VALQFFYLGQQPEEQPDDERDALEVNEPARDESDDCPVDVEYSSGLSDAGAYFASSAAGVSEE